MKFDGSEEFGPFLKIISTKDLEITKVVIKEEKPGHQRFHSTIAMVWKCPACSIEGDS